MKHARGATLATALAMAIGPAAMARGQGDPSSDLIVVRMGEVEFERAALLGTSVTGVMGEVLVKPGDLVKAGQLLGRMQDLEVRAELDLRAAEADSDIAIRLKEARLAQARSKLRRSETLSRQKYVSGESLENERIEVHAGALDVEEAAFRRKLAALQKAKAEAELKAREVLSPFDGEVVAVFKQPGEAISVADPILRVVDFRTMKVTGYLDVVDASKVAKGRRARVFPEVRGAELPIEQRSFEGRVSLVDAQIHRETQTCRVIVEVSNPDGLLRAGMEARIEILPQDRPSTPTPPASTVGAKPAVPKTASR